MARIYLSSTFEDLQEYRTAVYHTLRQMHHDVISMEDYVAGDERPLDKCLADVAACEVYVGIFALRYGFIPPKDNPERKSITELEYRKASAEGKERLVFLLDESASWPLKFIDALNGVGENGRLIKSIRDELSLEHRRAIFKTPDDLASKVSVAMNEVQQKWINARLEQQRNDTADAGARRAGRARQRVAGQPVLDIGEQFRGRLDEQRELGRMLGDKSTRLVSVIGRAGIGKTALASKVLRELERSGSPPASEALPVNGIVYLSTRTTGVTLERLFAECADLLDDEQKDRLVKVWVSGQLSVDDKVERLLQTLDQGVYLILLDHLEDLLDAQGRVTDPQMRIFVERSLAAPRGARLLVTSRTPLTFDAGTMRFDRRLPLTQGLSTDDGVSLLRELDPNGLLGLRDLPADQLARAVQRVHGVPKALEVLAGIKRDNRLRSLDAILDAFYQESLVDELIREGYRRLDSGERHIVDALAVLGRPVPALAVAFMVAPWCPGVNIDALLGRLIDVYMVTFHATKELLSIDAIDQDYALSQLPETGEYSRRSLNLRAAEYYSRLQIPADSWRTVSDVEPYTMEIDHRLAAADVEGAAATLSRVDANFVAVRGSSHRLAAQYARVQGQIRDTHLQALNIAGQGVLRLFLGPLEEAITCLTTARTLAQETADRELECRATGWMGEACRRLGRLDEAVVLLNDAVRMAGQCTKPTESFALLLSLTLSYKGEFRKAIACSEGVMTYAVSSGNVELRAHVHDGLSLAYLGLGDFEKAYECAQQAIDCYKQVGARDPLGYVFNVQGMACLGRGRLDEARRCLELGQRFGHDDSNPRLEGFSLFNLARLCRIANELSDAMKMAGAAKAILTPIGAAEASAAAALADAVTALQCGNRVVAAHSLLACGRASMTSADLYPPLDLFTEAKALASAENLGAVAADAQACIDLMLGRRNAGEASADPARELAG